MENQIVCYLLRTQVTGSRANGLSLKLRIYKVNKVLETFDDAQTPAATLMSHGLFLASPTSTTNRSPTLIAVLNQPKLQQNDPKTQFGIVFAQHESSCMTNLPDVQSGRRGTENFLGKRASVTNLKDLAASATATQCEVSLRRNGVLTKLPCSVPLFDQEVLTSSKVFYQTIPHFPITTIVNQFQQHSNVCDEMNEKLASPVFASSQIVISVLRCISDPPQKVKKVVHISGSLQQAKLDGTLVRTKPKKAEDLISFLMRFFQESVTSMFSFIEHFEGFIPDNSPAFESGRKAPYMELYDLSNLILHHLLRPLVQHAKAYLEKAGPKTPKLQMLEASIKSASRFIAQVERLVLLCSTWLNRLQLEKAKCLSLDHHRPSFLEVSEIPKLLQIHEISSNYCAQAKVSLASCPSTTEGLRIAVENFRLNQESTSHRLEQFMKSSVTADFKRVSDQFFGTQTTHGFVKVLNARVGTSSWDFSPKLDPPNAWRIEAICIMGKFQICIFTEDLTRATETPQSVENLPLGMRGPIVSVFGGESQIATFRLPNCRIMEQSSSQATKQFFSGRYFVRSYQRLDLMQSRELAVLDLGPCSESNPKPPVFRLMSFSCAGGRQYIKRLALGCTNRYLSFISVQFRENSRSSCQGLDSAQISIFRYSQFCKTGRATQTITLPDSFLKIMIELVKSYMDVECLSDKFLLWSRNGKHAFFIHFSLQSDSDDLKPLIVVFDVSETNGSAELLTHCSYKLKGLASEEISPYCDPQFKMMYTRIRDYLVLDINRPTDEHQAASYKGPTCVRVLFTVHKKQLHRVLVNGDSSHMLPWHIGHPIACAGYDTKHMSLFHHRRVFSAHKVVSAVYNLVYKPL